MNCSVFVLASLLLLPADDFNGTVTERGAEISGLQTPSGQRQPPGRAAAPRAKPLPAPPAPASEFRVVIDCPANTVDGFDETLSCQSAVDACRRTGEGPGPRANVYVRVVGERNWTPLGPTCLPEQFTAANPGALTLGDIQRAFAETPFATPIGSSQPVGGRTLVNLPTYFALTWPDQGYRPGQTRSLTMLGHAVDLRLKTGGHRYDYGDGATHGPTTSTGGPYPTGDITHTYRRAGTLSPTATTVITADYRIDGGPWQPLPGSSTQTTTFPTLTVLTATNRLTADPT